MENTQDVSGNSSPSNSEVVNTQTQLPEASVVTSTVPATPVPGSQTPSENLLAALKEERRKRQELEDKLNNLNTTAPSEEVYSDEGKLLSNKISSLEAKLEQLEEDKVIAQVHSQFPMLKELSNEFDEFRRDFPRHKMENVAKLFLNEKGLLEPVRKGLEKPTGGVRIPMTSEMSHDDVKNLRENNPAKYRDMLKKGLIKL